MVRLPCSGCGRGTLALTMLCNAEVADDSITMLIDTPMSMDAIVTST
jgi:hypothetical protein